MADDTTNASPQSDNVKQSFAWGQLFVGSILAGFSIYHLGLKITSMPPSEMLAGFVATYEAVRDFLMIPFSWMQLDLTASEKNLVAVCVVLLAAAFRASVRLATLAVANAVTGAVLANYMPNYDALGLQRLMLEQLDARQSIVMITILIVLTCVLMPLIMLRVALPDGNTVSRASELRLVLLNIVFTALCGTVLLLLNWATS